MVRRAFNKIFILKLKSDLSVSAEPRWNWHLVPLIAVQVVKASQGHYPQPFLISK
jgi:hypothetical protein